MTTTIITLSKGKKVGNFSSPHHFLFTDGSVLESQSNAVAEKLKVDFIETELGTNGDIALDFSLSIDVKNSMQHWLDLWVTNMYPLLNLNTHTGPCRGPRKSAKIKKSKNEN